MTERERDRALDGLRGVAALVVVIYHCLLVIPALSIPADGSSSSQAASASTFSLAWWVFRTPVRVLWAGPEAVLVFFVLSGFVLTLPLRKAAAPSWPRYYLRRWCRLYLPVWGALIIAVALGFAVTRSASSGSVWLRGHGAPSVSSAVRDVTLVLGTSTVDGPLWSLRWEIWFSLLLPICFVMLQRICVGRRWMVCIFALATVSAVAASLPSIRDIASGGYLLPGLLRYLPVFGIGMVMALNLDRVRATSARLCRTARGPRSGLRAGVLGIVAVVLLVSPSYPAGAAGGPVGQGVTAWLSLLGVVMVVALTVESAGLRRALGYRTVQWAGSRSFSIYLVHEPLIVALALFIDAATPWPWLLVVIGAIPAVLVVAEVFHRMVERPTLRLAARLGRRPEVEGPVRAVRKIPV